MSAEVSLSYDTCLGNTEVVAHAIAAALGTQKGIRVAKASMVTTKNLTGLKRLVIVCPTHRRRSTEAMNAVMSSKH